MGLQWEIKAGRGRRRNHRQYKGIVGRTPHRRQARQESAKDRQAIYDALSLEDRLARIARRPGASQRERSRILEQIRV